MNQDKLHSPQHSTARAVLRAGGPVVAVVGVVFIIVAMGSFFSAFGTFEPPRYFWCAFVGMPLLIIGLVMSWFGYMGAVYRYMAGEGAPVAKDVVNYMGENIQPGVKAVAKAVTEGIVEAQNEQQPKPPADA
ncbi:MAG TPA: hypothetical protein VGJ39_16150 [Vicinamibacterales bacterium]|jgi:hypothetical protein